MHWLRTKYRDTFYPDARAGEAHVRGLKAVYGIRSDGQFFEAHALADEVTEEELRAHLNTMLDGPRIAETILPLDAGKGDPGWIEEAS